MYVLLFYESLKFLTRLLWQKKVLLHWYHLQVKCWHRPTQQLASRPNNIYNRVQFIFTCAHSRLPTECQKASNSQIAICHIASDHSLSSPLHCIGVTGMVGILNIFRTFLDDFDRPGGVSLFEN